MSRVQHEVKEIEIVGISSRYSTRVRVVSLLRIVLISILDEPLGLRGFEMQRGPLQLFEYLGSLKVQGSVGVRNRLVHTWRHFESGQRGGVFKRRATV